MDDLQQKKWPNVSVIIVNWNGAEFLNQCLSALMAQTLKPYEIILLDNDSSDGSVDIVQRFSFVRLIALAQNTGFARGNNLAIEEASDESEWIALINPDAFAEPHWLEELIAAAQRNPAFDFFASKLLNAGDTSLLDGEGDAYHLSGRVWRLGRGASVMRQADSNREVFSPCAAAALYRRSALCKIGGFDEDYFCYVEDVDLGFRLRLAGYRCLYVPQSVAHHVGSGTTGGRHSHFSVYHGHRNLVWTFIKNMPGILFWMLLPIHILLNIVSIIYFSMHGQGKLILTAKWDAIKGVPKMWRKRLKIQSARKASIMTIWHILDKRFWLANKY
ncbi:MAG: glycosyltransferase family 2 protein [Methylobacter sp.]|nr:MAG: glycosyltransferase family 2 protein [Methylobacter sp.]